MSRKDKQSQPNILMLQIILAFAGTVLVAYFGYLSIQTQVETPIHATQTAEARFSSVITKNSTVIFKDAFDNSDGSYDLSLWHCDQECDINSLFLKNGVLNLRRESEGYTSLLSADNWVTSHIVSLTGDLQMQRGSKFSTGWLRLENSAGCDINGGEFNDIPVPDPYIQCYFGTYDEKTGKHEYETDHQPVNFDTWYNVKIEFEKNSNKFSFYLDEKFIGKYTSPYDSIVTPVGLGIWVEDVNKVPYGIKANGTVFIDNVLLSVEK